MKLGTIVRLAVVGIGFQFLPGCGSTATSNPSTSPNTEALNGNWLLTGSRQLKQFPFLSMALIVSGNQINARGDQGVLCSNPPAISLGGSFSLTGQINSNGTFHLADASLGVLANGGSSVQIVIDGSVPATGSSSWTGTYSFTSPAGYTGCIVNSTGTFTATALTPINATYAGTLSGSSGSVTINSTLAQAAGVSLPGPLGTVEAFLPLSGTITVTGSPCFTHGTTSIVADASQIEGDIYSLIFTMDDGSTLVMNGWFVSPDESVVYPATSSIIGGNCNQNSYVGTLTRQ